MAVKLSKRAVDMAAQMGADQVTVHPGREGLLLPGVDFDAMQAEAAVSIGQYGKKSGVSVSFEIMEKIPKERFTSAEAVLRMERCAKGVSAGDTQRILRIAIRRRKCSVRRRFFREG